MKKLNDKTENKYNSEFRQKCGLKGGIAGIAVNAVIFIIEIAVSIAVNSKMVATDAISNLTDALSSVITILCFKIGSKFSLGGKHKINSFVVEQISALIVSFIILAIGIQSLFIYIGRIIHPTATVFSLISFWLLIAAIPLKIFLGLFSSRLGKLIDSPALRATSQDALGDVLILIAACASLLCGLFGLRIDGYLGSLTSLFIIYSGITTAVGTIKSLKVTLQHLQ